MEELDIIKGIKNSDIKCFELLFNTYYARSYQFVYGFVKDEWLAEDIVQNIFMKIWIRRDHLDEEKSMKNYIFLAAKFEIYNHFRLKYNRIVSHFSELPSQEQVAVSDNIEDSIEVGQMKEMVEQVVSEMPERRRIIFKMSKEQGLTAKEIGEKLGISSRTVEKHIELALHDIRAKLPAFSLLLFLLSL